MGDAGPTRTSADLADVVELLLDKGLVVNADIAVSIGDTQLLGIQIRAAVASFETAAKYGLEFPEGTDQQRIEEAANAGRIESSTEAVESSTGEEDDDMERTPMSPSGHPEQIPIAGPAGNVTESDSPADDEETESAEATQEEGDRQLAAAAAIEDVSRGVTTETEDERDEESNADDSGGDDDDD
jgi:hypothetical protein